ncbi:RND family transporter [Halococcus sp. IIIV-5B]|uniref:efflux RND transporter permease subunit n=1 Tax=Halococcus sp. IIIV-5B TaxID=2321230 RepID=UPI000E76247A|nr:MMPL family transporter [Halococcus sp. IIIV-5B]RJT06571.1 RND transporter [Halococcus sp. IIIV-5B]
MVSFDYQRYIDWADEWITERPKTVVLVFLVVTAVFAVGLTNISTSSGTSQFTDDSPAQTALDNVNEEFSPTFSEANGSTQLIQRGSNVLSKDEMLAMLTLQQRAEDDPSLRVASTSSAAAIVAQTLDPEATTLDDQIDAIKDATPTEIESAIGTAAENDGFTSLLSNDFNAQSASASATIGTVTHDVPGGISESAGTSGSSPLTAIQTRVQSMAGSVDSDITVFGNGIVSAEFTNIIFDSLIIVVPAAALLILVFLIFAYRDPIDLLLGVVSLVLAIVWTFGFTGLAGLPFSQMLIAVPPLLLAVGIDFGIHTINRYREERVQEYSVTESMRTATDQLFVAFFIVTGTTVVGFAANGISDLQPIRQFGLVAAVGIVFTFLIFGIFLPAAKVWGDHLRVRYGIPEFGLSPLGAEGSLLGRVLTVGVSAARRAPYAVLVLTLLLSVVAGSYATGVDTTFSQDDFLPPEDLPGYVEALPEPFAPGDYSVTDTTNFLEDNFATTQGSSVTVYAEGNLRSDSALESIQRANRNPPDAIVTNGRTADADSIMTVIDDYANQSSSFAALVERNDVDGDGVPDDNLGEVYDALLDSPYRAQALNYITEDYRSTQVVYSVDSDATQDEVSNSGRTLADRYRLTATATGQMIVLKAVSDTIFTSAIQSLVAALIVTAIFLVVIYYIIEGRPSLGLVNLVPIVVSVALLAGSMRLFGIPLNALTATILSIAIGLGVDYSSHFVHRFVDEYHESGEDVFVALDDTVRGTGGALTGSMLTTTTGIGVLALAITPILGQFGVVVALSIFFAYLTSMLLTPSVIVVWERWT